MCQAFYKPELAAVVRPTLSEESTESSWLVGGGARIRTQGWGLCPNHPASMKKKAQASGSDGPGFKSQL